MEPKDAALIIRAEAIDIVDLANSLLHAPPKNFTSEELKVWFVNVMLQFAEFKWTMADLIEEHSKVCDFKLHKVIVQKEYDLENPPFECEFFNNHD